MTDSMAPNPKPRQSKQHNYDVSGGLTARANALSTVEYFSSSQIFEEHNCDVSGGLTACANALSTLGIVSNQIFQQHNCDVSDGLRPRAPTPLVRLKIFSPSQMLSNTKDEK